MKRFLIPALLVLLLPPALSADPGDVVPLHQAFRDREVGIQVIRTSGYARVELRLVNLSSQPRRVKLPGSYLQPRSSGYQRLALGYARKTKEATVLLEGKRSWRGWVTSCCMDGGKHSPRSRTPYRIAPAPAPPRIAKIMVHWSKHPDVSQGAINGFVWGNSCGPLPTGPPGESTEPDLYALDGARLFAWGERLLVLCGTHELVRRRWDGTWEQLGAGVRMAEVGYGRILACFDDFTVAEYNETEKAWIAHGKVLGARALIPGPMKTFVLAGENLLALEGGERWRRLSGGVAEACLSQDPSAGYVFTTGTRERGCRIRRTTAEGGRWFSLNRGRFAEVFCTADNVFGRDGRGLVRVSGESFRRLHRGRGTILAHRRGLFCVGSDGTVREYHDGADAMIDRPRARDVRSFAVDPVTGTLWALQDDGRIQALEPMKRWEEKATFPEPDAILNPREGR